MTAVKESSTNQLNKQNAITDCPVSFTLTKIGGRWKPLIIWNLREGKKRYSELKKLIPAITEKMLIQHLKQLQDDNLVIRKAENVVPPFVTYYLSDAGEDLTVVLNAMAAWGLRDSQRQYAGRQAIPA